MTQATIARIKKMQKANLLEKVKRNEGVLPPSSGQSVLQPVVCFYVIYLIGTVHVIKHT